MQAKKKPRVFNLGKLILTRLGVMAMPHETICEPKIVPHVFLSSKIRETLEFVFVWLVKSIQKRVMC